MRSGCRTNCWKLFLSLPVGSSIMKMHCSWCNSWDTLLKVKKLKNSYTFIKIQNPWGVIVLKFSTFHRKTTVLESRFDKVTGLQASKFNKKRLQYRCFPVKFLIAPFLTEHLQRLLLKYFVRTSLMLAVTATAFWFVKYLFPIDGDTLNQLSFR